MPAPFITLTFGTIIDGRLEDFEHSNRAIAELVEAKEPRVIAFHAFLSEDGKRFAGMQFHPDAASMAFHLQLIREAVEDISGSLRIEEFKVLGPSNEMIDGMLASMADAGITVEHLPDHGAGFTRSSADD